MVWTLIRARELEAGHYVRPINHSGPICEVVAVDREARTFTVRKVSTGDDTVRLPRMAEIDEVQPLRGTIAIVDPEDEPSVLACHVLAKHVNVMDAIAELLG